MNVIKVLSEIIGVRQDIHELARQIDYKTRTLDRLIDDMVECLKHKRLIETVSHSKKPCRDGVSSEENQT